MTAAMLVSAAVVWTYWLAPALVGSAIATVVALAVGYYRKILVPTYQRRIYEARQRHLGTTNEPPAEIGARISPGPTLSAKAA